MQNDTCRMCGTALNQTARGRRRLYCSRACRQKASRDRQTRVCDVTGCDNPHRARGLCATHYNQLVMGESKRHPKDAVNCVVCGTTVLRRRDRIKIFQPTCSVRCRTVVQWGQRLAPTSTYEWRRDAVKRAREHGAPVVQSFDREEIFDRDDWTCALCGIRCSSPDPFTLSAATVDHVVSLSAGGNHTLLNVQTACLSCNSRKQAASAPAAA